MGKKIVRLGNLRGGWPALVLLDETTNEDAPPSRSSQGWDAMLPTWAVLTSASIRRGYWQHRAHPSTKSAKGWDPTCVVMHKPQRAGHAPGLMPTALIEDFEAGT